MDLVSRLKRYLDSRQISITQFADECGIPRPTGSQLLAGRNKKVSDEIIGKIHAAYPNLNIVWLMFGEGDMVTSENIETSEAQNAANFVDHSQQQPIDQPIDFEIGYSKTTQENSAEKISEPLSTENASTTFTFATPAEPTAPIPPQPHTIPTGPEDNAADESITLTPGKGKRVTGIVVYYDDCTYESFIPDPTHSHPFMR